MFEQLGLPIPERLEQETAHLNILHRLELQEQLQLNSAQAKYAGIREFQDLCHDSRGRMLVFRFRRCR